MHLELPEEHGLRDHRVSDPHLPDRLHQGADEQLAGPRPCAVSLREHQHHRPEPRHGERQNQSGCAGDHGRRVPGARWAQEDPGGHAALPEVCLRENTLPGTNPTLTSPQTCSEHLNLIALKAVMFTSQYYVTWG